MTNAPAAILAERRLWLDTIPALDPLAVGIVGDDNHAKTGSSYHLGRSALRPDSYSIVESTRDREGLTEDAAAIDVGYWSITVNGTTHTLRTYNAWLIRQCVAGAADTQDIREVIYSLDGKTVKRWDRLGRRTTGDTSHLSHTHKSYFRDSTGRDKTALTWRYFTETGLIEGDDMTFEADQVPVKYPAESATNPTVKGPWALGSARDLAQETRDLTKALTTKVDLMQKAVLAAVQGVNEEAVLAAVNARAAELQQEIEETRLGNPGQSAAEVVAALRSLLGGRTDLAEVGRLLAS